MKKSIASCVNGIGLAFLIGCPLVSCHADDPAPITNPPHAPRAQSPVAEAPADLPPEARAAWTRLCNANRFADSMVGDDGALPPEGADLRVLVAADPNGTACAQLFEHATIGGRLFALCGLWWRDPKRFAAGVSALSRDARVITFQSGCETLIDQRVADLVHLHGAIRLVDRKQTIADWIHANGGESAQLDIAGGGYPRRLLGLE